MTIAGFQHIGVIGAGQMGGGIAQVCASKGLSVQLIDLNQEVLDRARDTIGQSLGRLVKKEKLSSSDKEQTEQRIQYGSSMGALTDCDLVIEAVSENEQVKAEVIKQMDQNTSDQAILASNTSSIPITRLASHCKSPELFMGIHFMNPVPIMKLVEMIDGIATAQETSDRCCELVSGLGKEISRSQDYPGFVVNRILMPLINEAFDALMEGVASAEDIDKGAKFGLNHPMGPLQLADLIGLDTCLAIMSTLHEGLGESRYRPSPLLRKHVEAGFLGRKTGRGVYQY